MPGGTARMSSLSVLRSVVCCLALCAAAPLSAQVTAECDPENYFGRPQKERTPIDKAFNAEPRLDELRVVVRVPLEKAKRRTMLAMLACKMPVALSNEGMLIADYGSHAGAISSFSIVARAILLPLDDSTTIVRLVAQEQASGTYQNSQKAITNKNAGKSRDAWIQMRNVAKQLLADSTLRADWSQSTKLGLVYIAAPQ